MKPISTVSRGTERLRRVGEIMSLSERMWPTIKNAAQAESAVQNGAAAAFFIAGVTILCAILALTLGHPVLGIGSASIVDGIIFGVVGWRLIKQSFPWAIFGFAMYVCEKWYQFFDSSLIKNPVAAILVISLAAFLAASIRGAHFLRAERRVTRTLQTDEGLPFVTPNGPVS